MRRHPRAGLLQLLALIAVSTPAGAVSWYDQDWSHRIQLTASPSAIAGTETMVQVPLLVTLASDYLADVFDRAQADASDLVFTAGDGTTVLGHEVVAYDPVGETGELWFQANALSATANVFYMYYGNPDTSLAPPAAGPWTDDHLAVYHFERDPSLGVLPDAGPTGHHAQVGEGSQWASDDLVPGPIGQAWRFDDDTDWLYSENIASGDSSFTISAWFANSADRDGGACAFQSLDHYWDLWFQRNDTSDYPGLHTLNGFYMWNPINADTLVHHYLWTLDAEADTARFFFDGVEQSVLVHYAPAPPHKVYTGEPIYSRIGIAGPVFYNPLNLSDGLVDEFRLFEGALSPERVLTEYRNNSNPRAFFSAVQQERDGNIAAQPWSPGSTAGWMSAWPNPSQGWVAMEIALDVPAADVVVYDVAGRLVRSLRVGNHSGGLLRLHWDGKDDRGSAVGNGIYYVRAQGEHASAQTKILMMR